jgi:hypothetical protein
MYVILSETNGPYNNTSSSLSTERRIRGEKVGGKVVGKLKTKNC